MRTWHVKVAKASFSFFCLLLGVDIDACETYGIANMLADPVEAGQRQRVVDSKLPVYNDTYKDDIGDLQDIEILSAHILSNTQCKRRDRKTCSGPMSYQTPLIPPKQPSRFLRRLVGQQECITLTQPFLISFSTLFHFRVDHCLQPGSESLLPRKPF